MMGGKAGLEHDGVELLQQQCQSRSRGNSQPPMNLTQYYHLTLTDHNDQNNEVQMLDENILSDEDSDSLCSDEAGFNLPLVDYARLHKLTVDYLDEAPVAPELIPAPPAEWHQDLENPKETLSTGILVNLGVLNGHTTCEKLDVDKDAADTLAAVLKMEHEDDPFDVGLDGDVSRFNDLKMEEPILLSDPGLDINRLKRRNTVLISTHGMQSFPKKDICDLGFLSPERDSAMRDELERRVDEKLDINRSTMQYLSELYTQLSLKDNDDLGAIHSHKMARLPSPETPPLMPSSPQLQHTTPSIETTEMTLTSSPENLMQQEAAELEQRILGQDTPPLRQQHESCQLQRLDHSATYNLPGSLDDSSSSPLRHKRLQDLKVEVPLTPEDSEEPPAKKVKTVSFSTDLHTMIPVQGFAVGTSESELEDDTLTSFIENVIEPFAESALKQVEEEQLDELDTTMRVAVPHIHDFTLAVPWKTDSHVSIEQSNLNGPKGILLQISKEFHKRETKWSGVSKIESQLPWSPFPPKLGKVKLEEQFDDGSLSRYLADLVPEDGVGVQSLICEPDGLKLLDENDEESTLQPTTLDAIEETPSEEHVSSLEPPAATHSYPLPEQRTDRSQFVCDPGRLDMQTLLKRRKLQLAATNKPGLPDDHLNNTGRTKSPSKTRNATFVTPTSLNNLATATDGLSNFMKLHGSTIKATSLPLSFPDVKLQRDPPAVIEFQSKPNGVVELKKQHIAFPSPSVVENTARRCIVIPTTLLSDRSLIRGLQDALPGLEVIERESLASRDVIGNTKKSVVTEADITTSPGTGILLTSLQKLKQKPLPGQSKFLGVHDRISIVSSRYNRLIVLVGEATRQSNTTDGSGPSAAPLDRRDLEALQDVMGYASKLETEVEVYYVGGGDSELIQWVASCVSRHSNHEEYKLLQEETAWEHFLRQAGLNPFAAQFVLAELKPKGMASSIETPSLSGTSSPSIFGLNAFVQMTVAQRLETFGPAVGRRVLGKVSNVIDGEWTMI